MSSFDIIRSNDFPVGKVYFNKNGLELPLRNNSFYIRGVDIPETNQKIGYDFVKSVDLLEGEPTTSQTRMFVGGLLGGALMGQLGFWLGMIFSERKPIVIFRVTLDDDRVMVAKTHRRLFDKFVRRVSECNWL